MNIIKDKQLISNDWQHLTDEQAITNGDITVSLKRWNLNKNELLNHNGKVGIRLTPSDSLDDVKQDDINQFELIGLEFPAFTDGRSFSQARLLRDQHAFQGEIRALGAFMPDQAFYLQRVGVNAFEPANQEDLKATINTLNDFSEFYQTSTVN